MAKSFLLISVFLAKRQLLLIQGVVMAVCSLEIDK